MAIFSSGYGSLPLILGLVGLVMLVGFWWMFKMRLFVFRWWGAVRVPCVLVYEGNRLVPCSDKLRLTKDGNRLMFESKTFGDNFDGTHLQGLIQYGGKSATMLPVFRSNGEWFAADVARKEDGKMDLKPTFDSDQRLALAVMRKNNDLYLMDPSFWAANGPIIALLVVAICMLGSILILTQYTSSILNTATANIATSTNTLARAIDAYAGGNCSALTPVPTPPGPRR